MRNHRRTLLSAFVSAFLIAAFAAPAGAHLRKANAPRQHAKPAAIAGLAGLAASGQVAGDGPLEMYQARSWSTRGTT